MTVSVYLIDSGATTMEGAAEEVLGGLADVGTTAELAVECARGSTLEAVAALCARLGPIRVVHASIDTADSATHLRAEIEARSARESVFAILIADGASPCVVVAGPDLPAMGPASRCDLAQLDASLRYALGDLDMDAESLFTEPVSLADGDEQLLERLRQLYGE
jgi:hypothetical protein